MAQASVNMLANMAEIECQDDCLVVRWLPTTGNVRLSKLRPATENRLEKTLVVMLNPKAFEKLRKDHLGKRPAETVVMLGGRAAIKICMFNGVEYVGIFQVDAMTKKLDYSRGFNMPLHYWLDEFPDVINELATKISLGTSPNGV